MKENFVLNLFFKEFVEYMVLKARSLQEAITSEELCTQKYLSLTINLRLSEDTVP